MRSATNQILGNFLKIPQLDHRANVIQAKINRFSMRKQSTFHSLSFFVRTNRLKSMRHKSSLHIPKCQIFVTQHRHRREKFFSEPSKRMIEIMNPKTTDCEMRKKTSELVTPVSITQLHSLIVYSQLFYRHIFILAPFYHRIIRCTHGTTHAIRHAHSIAMKHDPPCCSTQPCDIRTEIVNRRAVSVVRIPGADFIRHGTTRFLAP